MIYIDGIFLTQRINGINRYSREVLLELNSRELPFNITVLVPKGANYDFKSHMVKIEELDHKNVTQQSDGKIYYKGWTRRTAEPYAYRNGGIFVNFSGYTPRKAIGPSVIHDLRPLCFDDKLRTLNNFRFKFIFWLNCQIAKFRKLEIVTVSEYTKNTIIEKIGINKEKIQVSYCGWNHIEQYNCDDTIFKRYPELKKGEYYFALGSVAPHKNYTWILEVARKNPQAIFAVAGGKELSVFGDGLDFKGINNIVYLGYVSDEEAKALMKYCKAFLFPSLYEGFGIPPLEAMYMGAEVISSNLTCLPEILGNSVHYIDAYDANIDLNNFLRSKINIAKKREILKRYTWGRVTDVWVKLLSEMERTI